MNDNQSNLIFYIVCPDMVELSGSEGIPEALPEPEKCRIAYCLDRAEEHLLELQLDDPENQYIILKSISYAAKSPLCDLVYRVEDTISMYEGLDE